MKMRVRKCVRTLSDLTYNVLLYILMIKNVYVALFCFIFSNVFMHIDFYTHP